MEAYSEEFRRDALCACDAVCSTREVALRFHVSESWVLRIEQERREQGKIAPKTTRTRRRVWRPYAYLPELQAALVELSWQSWDVRSVVPTERCGEREKKTLIAIEQDRQDVVEARRQ